MDAAGASHVFFFFRLAFIFFCMNPNFVDIELDTNFFADNFFSSSHGLTTGSYYDTSKFNSKFNNLSLNDLSVIHVNIRYYLEMVLH